jgi:hypothetical protein
MSAQDVHSVVAMYLELCKQADSEEAERWLSQQESCLSRDDVRKIEKELAKLED